jgi:hypothetical protein
LASRAQAILAQLRNFPGLDPRAVLAVAAQEGLGGGIGDNGTSFGPFQLHQGGAYPGFAPQSPLAAQSWAWSPAGIDYALRQIAQVAANQRGQQAIASIVHGFERSANQPAEIAGAERAYGQPLPNVPMQPGPQNVGGGLWSVAPREQVIARSRPMQRVAPPLAQGAPPPAQPQVNPEALAGLQALAGSLARMFQPGGSAAGVIPPMR